MPLPHRRFSLLEPADVGAQGGAVVADFALGLQLFQGLEQVVFFQGVDAGVMDLVEVDVVGVQAAEALFAGKADKVRVELLGAFLMADARGELVVEVVAELGGDDQVVAAVAEDFGQDFLAVALAVGVGGVEEVDAQVEGVFEEGGALFLGDFAPPSGGDGPDAEAYCGKGEVGAGELPVVHSLIVSF